MALDRYIETLQGIKDEGNIVFIKLDGERKKNKITVVIDFPLPTDKETIRLDGDDLDLLLEKSINIYKSKCDLSG